MAAEVPDFLSDEECRVVIQLAQLKGLMESQVMVPEGQEELSEQLNLSPEEIFHLLDLNQDHQLQPQEVCVHLCVGVCVCECLCVCSSPMSPVALILSVCVDT